MIGTTNAIEQRRKRAFIEDGLRMHLDGIENTRQGHKTDITTWQDLSGNNIDWVRTGGGVTFSTNCVIFSNTDFLQPVSGCDPSIMDGTSYLNNYTFQYTFQKTNDSVDGLCCFPYHSIAHWNYYIFAGISVGASPTCYLNNYTTVYKKFHQITVIYAPTGVQFYINNNLYPVSYGGDYTGQNQPTIGQLAGYCFYGNVYAIRVWNRPLTEDERLTMFEYDKDRFNIPV